MRRLRRPISTALLVGVAALAYGSAQGQTYPSKPVTVVVPQAAAGANDVVARVVMQKLSESLGQSFVIDNRPGAGGNIGTAYAAKAPRDGYTLLMTSVSSHSINPSLYKTVPFDPVKDFEPITIVATAPYLLVAGPSFPGKSVKDLIDLAKSKPGQIDYASAGNGTLNHLLGEMFKTAVGIDLVHIPYKGAAAAAADVVGGRVPVTFGSFPGVMPFVKSNQLTILGAATEKRTPLAPDVPAVSEAVPGFGATAWYGLVAPAGTPKEIIAKLHGETVKILGAKDLQEKLAAQGAEAATSSSPEEFGAFIIEDLARWAKVVKASGAQID